MRWLSFLRFKFVLLLLIVGHSGWVRADVGERPKVGSQVIVMTIKGPISKKTVDFVSGSVVKVHGDPIPAGLIVLLDSSGGDGVAAMKIGRMLRAARAHIFVTGHCSSACTFILASGVVRGAPAYTVGVHRGRITVTDGQGKILSEIDAKENPKAAAALMKFEREAQAYFAEMGMSPKLFETMQSHERKGVFRLNHNEIAKFRLSGFEPQYFAQRARFYEAQTGVYRMDGEELRRRTAKVASRCGEFQSDRKGFTGCYLEVLRDKYLN